MEGKKYPYSFIDEKDNRTKFVYLNSNNEPTTRTIPQQGIIKYLFDLGKLDEVEYSYKQQDSYNAQYAQMESDIGRQRARDRYYCRKESRHITTAKCELNYMDEEDRV